jgi:hypothetical protein
MQSGGSDDDRLDGGVPHPFRPLASLAHVMEMQGRAQEGIGWMIAREPYWSGACCGISG